MAEKCKKMVWHRAAYSPVKCTHNAKRDGYCGIHHPDAVKRRGEKAEARYKAKGEAREAIWKRQDFNRRAGARCRELGIQPEEIK